MIHNIYSNITTSISELKKHPMATINSANGEPIAVLSHNQPVFYCISPKMYEAMIEALDDLHLATSVKEREGEEEIEVDINDL